MNKSNFETMTALVVDDEPMMRVLLKGLLQEIGFGKIMEAEDGAAALALLDDSHHIDIVICDLEMPIIGGLEFVGMLRKSDTLYDSRVPVIIVTGHSEQSNIQEAVRLGIHGFLVKPFSRTNLQNQIVRALDRPAIDLKKLAPKKRDFTEVEVLDFNQKK